MYKKSGGIMAFFFMTIVLFNSSDTTSQTRERSSVLVKDTWNLSDLYPSDDAWTEAKTKLISQFDQVLQYKGKMASASSLLLDCLELNSNISREFGRLGSYAYMKSDEDTRNAKTMAMKQEIIQLATDFNSKSSFIEPEILEMDRPTIDRFILEQPGLAFYKMYLDNLQRRKAHKLTEKEEKILAEAGLLSDSPSTIYEIFSNAELPYQDLKLSDGTVVKLNQAGYGKYRALQNREDRERVFETFWKNMNQFRQTFGAQLYAEVKNHMFTARCRNYPSCLESALDINNIPKEVYLSLVDNVNQNLDTFHRYLRLRKRMLGVDTLKYSDLYAPVVKGVDLQYSIDEANRIVMDALSPMGEKVSTIVKNAVQNRWIDVYPTTGKKSGAYSNGSAYDVHPYILMNFNGRYQEVSTLAHELGHTMHSYLSNKTQPYPMADYATFVAEVASTFNEALLMNKMLKDIKDDDVRLSLLMEYLDGIKGTVFRQTQFAEFELRMHEMAEKGEPLTGDVLTQLYGDILKKYYGHDKGVCFIPDFVTVEWAYIPHFYYNFYVFQYATSFTASVALSEKVISKEKGAMDNYIQFLSAGGSDYPIDLLKKSGVDMKTSEPFQKTMTVMNRTMDQIEKILNKKGK